MKDGKCVSKRRSSSGKKSFNPFKMWGSYVGALILFIPLFYLSFTTDCSPGLVSGPGLCDLTEIIAWISLIIGFLIGWGIHSIFRAIRNRK